MNNNIYEIKELRKDAFVKEIIFLIMSIVSLTVALMPFISASAKKTPGPFFIIGGIAFLSFASLFIFYIYRDFNPKNAMILSSKGFIDIKNIGDEIEVEWTNVSSVKMLGKGETPFLGISLENVDIIMQKMKRNEADIMRENIEDGLPAILISQSDVRTPIKQLRDTIVSYVKDSRTLHNDTPKKEKKLNPFTTTAVLRAFGQEDPKVADDTIVSEENVIDNSNTPEKDNFYDALQATTANDTVNETSVDESKTDVSDNNEEYSADDMPEEIKELLSRAKSSKISELGKILAEKDVPYSMSREQAQTQPAEITDSVNDDDIVKEEKSDDTQINISSEHIDNTPIIDDDGEISTHLEMTDFITYVQDSGADSDNEVANNNNFETNLDSMLKTAFDNTREEIEREEKSIKSNGIKTDFDAGFFADLVMINDIELEEMPEEINAKDKYDRSQPADFITSIDDD